nr:unnamed protein product [Callosobruchus analis]
MNLSFHHPKKDQCTLCMQVHQTAENDIAENVKREFELHSANKNKVREIKQDFKNTGLDRPQTNMCGL